MDKDEMLARMQKVMSPAAFAEAEAVVQAPHEEWTPARVRGESNAVTTEDARHPGEYHYDTVLFGGRFEVWTVRDGYDVYTTYADEIIPTGEHQTETFERLPQRHARNKTDALANHESSIRELCAYIAEQWTLHGKPADIS